MGPVGYGIIFQFINFSNLVAATIHLGSPVGITARIPSAIKDDLLSGKSSVDDYFLYFIRIFGMFTFLACLIFIVFSRFLTDFLIGNSQDYISFIIIVSATPLIVVYSICESFLKCFGNITQIVIITIISSISSLILLYPLIKFLGIYGASVYIFLNGILPFCIYAYLNRDYLKKIYLKKIVSALLLKKQILKIGSVSLFSSFLFIGCFIILRKFVIDNLGFVDNGIFQAVVSLSTGSFLIVNNYLSSYLLPKISGFSTNDEIKHEIDRNFRFILFLMVPAILVVVYYNNLIIRILYSSDFLKASDFIIFQFIGDFFRGLAGLFGLWLISKMKIKIIMSFDILMNLILVTSPFIFKYLFNMVSLKIISISYMVACIVHFMNYFIISVRVLKYKISSFTAKTIFVSVVCLGSSYFFTFSDYLYQFICFFISCLLFGFFATTSEEKFKLMRLLRNRIHYFKNKEQ